MRLGANQTPFVDWEEGVYRYRFQGTVFSERVGKLTSSDFGLSFHTNLPDNYGEIHTGVYNGEGYTQAEPNNRKAIQTRVTIRPLPKGGHDHARSAFDWLLRLGHYVRHDDEESISCFMALFEHPHVVAGYDYLDAVDQPTAAAAA